ncbi:PPOX class F420-dependent oxidoreductase [Rhodococcus sp. G-MC3]|uniref:PPOX class F420-dependent oxidoreductase n=1 Tax=Rhodococcus sp. G-MC3 TaxID=3046209 RepID=UPI0024BB8B14|nr:PPOX class F420-dependent oxidoreductase [Rhodococcus sp. G-MC3]MDJ0396215.1 PPOX class F420-dependent oxidoreductase [Rhodococcus sp. G-MC3]
MSVIPESHVDLLTRPLYAHLATIRPDGSPQANPMWFNWDGTHIRFTNTSTRKKSRNVAHEPRIAFSVNDPDQPYRYLEVRGRVVNVEPDPNAELFMALADRYDLAMSGPPGDAPDRVVFVVEPTSVSYQ